MKKNSYIDYVLVLVASLYGFLLGIRTLVGGNVYGSLICFLIILVMLLPWIIEKLFKIEIPGALRTVYLIFVFVAHFLGSIVDFYHAFNNYDKLMHFLSGILTGLIAIYIVSLLKGYDKKRFVLNIIFILGFSMLIASAWEMFEFTCDNIFGKDAQNVLTTGVDDTMWDMIVAFIGSILVSILYIVEVKTHKKILVTKLVK